MCTAPIFLGADMYIDIYYISSKCLSECLSKALNECLSKALNECLSECLSKALSMSPILHSNQQPFRSRIAPENASSSTQDRGYEEFRSTAPVSGAAVLWLCNSS